MGVAVADEPVRGELRLLAAQQRYSIECLLYMHAILASARGLRLLHIREAGMSLRPKRMLAPGELARAPMSCHFMPRGPAEGTP